MAQRPTGASSTGSTTAASPPAVTRPTTVWTPTWRPGRKRLDDQVHRHPRQRHAFRSPRSRRPAGRRRRLRGVRIRRLRTLRPLLRRWNRRHTRFAAATAAWPRVWPGARARSGRKPHGLIKAPLSADGRHLIFGSTSQFELDGNDETGDVSIYQRNLITARRRLSPKRRLEPTSLASKDAGACHLPGNGDGIAELAISADGSSVVVAQRVSTDSAGNQILAPLPACRFGPGDHRPGSGRDKRRPLRRDDGRRLDGLLYDARSTRRR